MDRYAYTNNSPLNFTDPSGHATCNDDGVCNDGTSIHIKDDDEQLRKYYYNIIRNRFDNVEINDLDMWNPADLMEIYTGLNTIMGKNGFNGNIDAFREAFGRVTFNPVANGSLDFYDDKKDEWVKVNAEAHWDTGIINVTPNSSSNNIIHEMGHIFSGSVKRINRSLLSYRQMYPYVFDGGPGATYYGQQAGPVEDFADSFLMVILSGPQTSEISKPRRGVITMLVASYTNSKNILRFPVYPGR